MVLSLQEGGSVSTHLGQNTGSIYYIPTTIPKTNLGSQWTKWLAITFSRHENWHCIEKVKSWWHKKANPPPKKNKAAIGKQMDHHNPK